MLDQDKSIRALQVMSDKLHRNFSRKIYEMTWRGEFDLALEIIHDCLSHPNPGFQENRWFFVSAKTLVLSRAGHLDQCIRYAETELENLPRDQFHLPNISGAYCSLMNTIGSCLVRKGRMNEAMERFKTVIATARKYHHENELAVSYANTGALLITQNPSEAMSFLNKAESLAAGMDNHQLRAAIFGFMGECKLALENYDEAEFFLVKELNIAKELGSPSEIKHATSHLNHLYDKMNMKGFSEKFFNETVELIEKSSPFDKLWNMEQKIQRELREADNATVKL